MSMQQAEVASVKEAKAVDMAKNTFDGQKADLFINTGKLGRVFLVKVKGADGSPTLIAVHL